MQIRQLTTLLLASALVVGVVSAQETADTAAADGPAVGQNQDREKMRQRRQNMTDEEKQAMRERFENMSDEEKQAVREKREARSGEHRAKMRERWESMSDEERQAARERKQNRQGGKGKMPPPWTATTTRFPCGVVTTLSSEFAVNQVFQMILSYGAWARA